MSRISSVSCVIILSLLPAIVFAAPAHKQHPYHWHGYGFLPGYHQPPNETVPIYGPKGAITGEPDYTPMYYNGEWHYYGHPRFLHGRYNGGSFGPCWTSTPIGLMWNCG